MSEHYTAEDLYIGAQVEFNCFVFKIIDAGKSDALRAMLYSSLDPISHHLHTIQDYNFHYTKNLKYGRPGASRESLFSINKTSVVGTR